MPKPINPLVLELPRLKLGEHQMEVDLDDAFFANYPNAFIDGAQMRVRLMLHRTARHLDVRLHLQGSLTVACDRCLRPYAEAVDEHARILYSHDPDLRHADNVDDLQYLDPSAQELDLTQDVYDYASLALPQRRLPPDCPGPNCPPQVLSMLFEGQAAGPGTDANADEGEQKTDDTPPAKAIDPRWKALEALRNTSTDPDDEPDANQPPTDA